MKKGIMFSISSLLLQNMIYIPILFLCAESGIKLCKSIHNSRNDFKRELIRHFIILIICFVGGIISSAVEIVFSTKLLKIFKEIF